MVSNKQNVYSNMGSHWNNIWSDKNIFIYKWQCDQGFIRQKKSHFRFDIFFIKYAMVIILVKSVLPTRSSTYIWWQSGNGFKTQ